MYSDFTTKQHNGYIELFYNGKFAGNYDNDNEIEEAKREILGY